MALVSHVSSNTQQKKTEATNQRPSLETDKEISLRRHFL